MTAGFVYLEHPDLGGACQVPDSEDVLAMYEARGWVRKDTPPELDPDAPNTGALPANAYLAEQQAAERALAEQRSEQDPPDPPGDTAPPTKGPRAKTAGAPSTSSPSIDPASADDKKE